MVGKFVTTIHMIRYPSSMQWMLDVMLDHHVMRTEGVMSLRTYRRQAWLAVSIFLIISWSLSKFVFAWSSGSYPPVISASTQCPASSQQPSSLHLPSFTINRGSVLQILIITFSNTTTLNCCKHSLSGVLCLGPKFSFTQQLKHVAVFLWHIL